MCKVTEPADWGRISRQFLLCKLTIAAYTSNLRKSSPGCLKDCEVFAGLNLMCLSLQLPAPMCRMHSRTVEAETHQLRGYCMPPAKGPPRLPLCNPPAQQPASMQQSWRLHVLDCCNGSGVTPCLQDSGWCKLCSLSTVMCSRQTTHRSVLLRIVRRTWSTAAACSPQTLLAGRAPVLDFRRRPSMQAHFKSLLPLITYCSSPSGASMDFLRTFSCKTYKDLMLVPSSSTKFIVTRHIAAEISCHALDPHPCIASTD